MRRALQLALNGEGRVSPNPMVGAVIVNGDKIIGEGFHAFYGGPHAEVNAINSVKPENLSLLKDSTIYVTLEPCAHHGKTPPCANLIVDKEIPRVVIGASDPNPLVAGKGVKILKEAGIEVTEGVLEDECRQLNRKFIKAQTSDIPYVTLKWAESKDGYIAGMDESSQSYPVKFSSPLSSVWVHRQRAAYDAIMVGGNTERIDHPKLNVRFWGGNSPEKIVAHYEENIEDKLREMRKKGISSLLVEGGANLLQWFIDNDIYDEIRVEKSNKLLKEGLPAPQLPENLVKALEFQVRDNLIRIYRR